RGCGCQGARARCRSGSGTARPLGGHPGIAGGSARGVQTKLSQQLVLCHPAGTIRSRPGSRVAARTKRGLMPRMSLLDWKLGGRMFVRYPGMTVIGGTTLAVVMGLGAAWYEVTRQTIDPRLPLPDGDRIVRIDNWDAGAETAEARLARFRL